ncbi:hypothetical protein CC86DRAFT_397741 [Ophiobolus disseminans]|uniref:Uncharacterized protein n=1 Tax=Ophiobolus disseminans TaxID=1469910 RepID=A0A6A6ZIE5_9PLEO|nr:hypothetical protein CC86DRAFT_397741 [Ophiobolus disseminans]
MLAKIIYVMLRDRMRDVRYRDSLGLLDGAVVVFCGAWYRTGTRRGVGRCQDCRSLSALPASSTPVSRRKIASTILQGQMDTQAPADRREVFLTYHELFIGKNAQVRKTTAIRKILLNHLPCLKESAGDAYINNIISILKSLLEDRVFQSKEQASKHFLDLFTRSPLERSTGNISKKRKASPRRSINQILEEVCFRFIKQWLPSLLEKFGWICAAAVELTKWLQKQVHSAYMLAEVLQDNKGISRLQTIHLRVDTSVKNMDQDTELELMLQTTIAQQQNKISLAAGQVLIGSITTEFGLHYPNAAAEIKGTLTCDKHARSTRGIILINEDNIESDENWLQTEL